MELIAKLKNHLIYFVKENNIKYFINVPYKEFKFTNIGLEIIENNINFDPEITNPELVRNNAIEFYRQIDDDNVALALPILKPNEINLLLSLNKNQLIYIEKLMALYINSCYKTLVKNNIKVNREVFLVENERFKNFIMYFKNNHKSRTLLKKYKNNNSSFDIYINKGLITEENNKSAQSQKVINISQVTHPVNLKDKNEQLNNINNNDINNVQNPINNESVNIIENKDNNNEIPHSINIEDKKVEKEQPNNNSDTTNKQTSSKNNNDNNNNTQKNTAKDISKDSTNSTNIVIPASGTIDLNDLGVLTNKAIPNNVTINIEKVISSNNNDSISNNKEPEEVLENEIDDDVSDIDDMDDEDFELNAIDVSEAQLSLDDGNKTYKTVTSGGIKFVVGRKDEENLKPIEINKNNQTIDADNLNIEIPSNIIKGDNQINKNAGFASYFMLFFVSIFSIVLIMYIILK